MSTICRTVQLYLKLCLFKANPAITYQTTVREVECFISEFKKKKEKFGKVKLGSVAQCDATKQKLDANHNNISQQHDETYCRSAAGPVPRQDACRFGDLRRTRTVDVMKPAVMISHWCNLCRDACNTSRSVFTNYCLDRCRV